MYLTTFLFPGDLQTSSCLSAAKSCVAPKIEIEPQQVKAVLRYPGAKWRLGRQIISFFPSHRHYIEPYFGSGACFFLKEPAPHEVINDRHAEVINLFEVLRSRGEELAQAIELTPWAEEEYQRIEQHYMEGDSLERARRFLVRCWQAHGTQFGRASSNGWRHNGLRGHAYPARHWERFPDHLRRVIGRLKQAEIRNKPALDIITYYNSPDTLIYADPPYPLSTRGSLGQYTYEMTDRDHELLLDVLDQHQGSVVLSGYTHPLYEDRLRAWRRVEFATVAEHAQSRTEVLWLNQRATYQAQKQLPFLD
jgi:DNA adenine methylase